ncbi:MAG: cyclase family protein [Thermoflexales bacterium]|nr:cyclase family protein [Thermoflexales bacterium]
MPKIYDVTLTISESLIVWPGDPAVHFSQPSHLDRGHLATVTRLDMGAHTGTHVDAPCHFIRGGASVDSLDMDVLVGPALLVHAPAADVLSAAVLEQLSIPPGVQRVLFRTRNSDRWVRNEREFDQDFVAVAEDGARWLIERGIRLVGIDYLSIAPFDALTPTHQALLGAGVIVIESLALGAVSPGLYQLVCLPLKIAGCDGAPARVILIEG